MQLTFNSLEELDQFFVKYRVPVPTTYTEEEIEVLKTQNRLLLEQLERQVVVRKKRAKKGTALQQAVVNAELLIKKFVVFTRSDIGLPRYVTAIRPFEEWVATQNIEIQPGLAPRGKHSQVKYIPYYYENGVKILATDVAVRDKDAIKGASARPSKISRQILPMECVPVGEIPVMKIVDTEILEGQNQ